MSKYIKEYWKKAVDLIKSEVTDISFSTWIANLKPYEIKGDTFYLLSESNFQKNHVNSRFSDLIANCINHGNKTSYKVEFLSQEEMAETEIASVTEVELRDSSSQILSPLNPKYTFDSFVVGSGNRLAHAGAVAVSEAPAKAYNPLFIYGGSGLGKTHLLHAIGNHVAYASQQKVIYVSSEVFTNELINSIKDNCTEKFRNKYRNVDILMVDDVQFIAGKERIQEEFFHTFNALYESNKQIIITSDSPPKEMSTLEERLRSRFAWGLIADIQTPDLETRVAILKKKAETENLVIPDNVLLYIANNVASNIRDLEGALNRLIAYCKLLDTDINEEKAQKVLNDMFKTHAKREITCDIIINTVARHFDIRPEEIIGKKRNKEFAYPRQIAMYLCRELTDNSLPKLGTIFNRDHTTVMHNIDKISESIVSQPETKKAVVEIKKNILGK